MHKVLALSLAALSATAMLAQSAPAPQTIAVARIFPNRGQIGLFVANADGGDERPLLAEGDIDYDPAWSPDGAWIVFTSDRAGSADLYRVRPDGTGLERLTDDVAYDDQAAFSPDSRHLVFVSTRAGGVAKLWNLNLVTRKATPVTSGSGSDFRPSWSPGRTTTRSRRFRRTADASCSERLAPKATDCGSWTSGRRT